MDQRTVPILFSLLRSAICGEALTQEEKAAYSEELLPALFSIAKKHDVAQILAAGLEQNGLPGTDRLETELFKAVFRYEQLKYELEKLCQALEAAEIPFIPLKGSVIRRYYRVPWMRTSCDIDVLVHEEDLDRAVSYLVEHCEYTNEGKGSHDVSLYTANKNHVELHYDLVEDGRANAASATLQDFWNYANIKKEYSYWHEISDDMFYFYHIAHMAKHFEYGGCGVRPFIDLWILDHIEAADLEKRNALLKQGELFVFAEVARKLSSVWFENAEPDELSRQMEHYILSGGVYGSTENRVTVQQQKRGGKLRYMLSRIFVPYDSIKFYYPILQKHRWLTPVMQVRRWFRLLFGGRVKSSLHELKYNSNISSEQAEQTKQFLEQIGL